MHEIERKFLVRSLPSLDGVPSYEIEQGYLATELGRSEVRLRRFCDQLQLTVKRDLDDGQGSHSREETTIELAPQQWETLWAATEGRRVCKTRYNVPFGEYVVEIDVFKDGNAGIITAEVEFPNPTAAQAFIPPSWLGEEVTKRPEYSNWQLANHG